MKKLPRMPVGYAVYWDQGGGKLIRLSRRFDVEQAAIEFAQLSQAQYPGAFAKEMTRPDHQAARIA